MSAEYYENRYREIINLFYSISAVFSPGGDLHEALPKVLGAISKSLRLDKGMVTILNRKTREIVLSATYGLTEAERAKGRYQLGEGITGTVVETGKALVIPDISSEPGFLNRTGSVQTAGTKGFICVPVKTTNEVIGSLSIIKTCTAADELEEDAKVLTSIATMISRAVRLHQAVHEEQELLRQENAELYERLVRKYHPKNIVGNSSNMRGMYELIRKIAQTNSTVLILGESGTGKELVAQAIHYSGTRANRPFITSNCAALPEGLIESELFGHSKGAFTGAITDKAGKFQAANTGTIFLDEIGELSPAAQSKLLRVLQEREIEKIGSTGPIKVDVRVIAATNRDLQKLVEQGKFRADLYYRLNVFPITVPPLRERKTDIPLLADSFIEKYSMLNNKHITRISTPAIDMLMSYHWPGNVRELENCIERAVILADDVIHGYHLPPSLQIIKTFTPEDSGKLQRQLDAVEYELVIEELKRCSGNIVKAAKNLGITYRQFGLRISKYHIDIAKFKKNRVVVIANSER
ncbi:MAG: sigma 54-interacting transcriptional regulator [Spirochaetales bacterium]|nr:sigma 54-interacting transcriptional regulator [Spirochaetales bacterium]